MTKYFSLVLVSLKTTGDLSGRPWMKLRSRVPDVCSGKVLRYFKVFHSVDFGNLMAAEEAKSFAVICVQAGVPVILKLPCSGDYLHILQK